MRFSEQLYQLANEFRRQHLNSGDGDDGTRLIADWRDERRPSGSPSTGSQPPMGGPYVCGHLRRQDFLTARPRDVPSIKYAAQQLRKCARGAGVNSIFVASDGTGQGVLSKLTATKFSNNMGCYLLQKWSSCGATWNPNTGCCYIRLRTRYGAMCRTVAWR